MSAPLPDDPEMDCTDAAHPAWWRGYDYGTASLMREVTAILDGGAIGGLCGEPWESLRRRLSSLLAADTREGERDRWRDFDTDPPEEFRRVLVTNNLTARDAKGQMSHVWVGLPQRSSGPTDTFPHTPEKGSWLAFTDSDHMVQYLTHWTEIPFPHAPSGQVETEGETTK